MATACPDLESIAAYLDGRLSDPERARITEHLASCEECYALFSESAQTHVVPEKRTTNERIWRGWFPAPRLAWASAGAALAVAASVLWLVTSGREVPREPSFQLQSLVAAVGTDRPIEARLSGGFAYGPLRGPVRSGGTALVSPDVRIAAAQSEKALGAKRTPTTLHALGVAYLTIGDIDRAVPVLEQAVGGLVQNAEMLSDLSAAYLARGDRDNKEQDYSNALAFANRAVEVDHGLAEALFNRALALERLSLAYDARVAWNEYLKIDDQSGWAGEAREHLKGSSNRN
jgi:tetratricopeptide (TPR) repeat protein